MHEERPYPHVPMYARGTTSVRPKPILRRCVFCMFCGDTAVVQGMDDEGTGSIGRGYCRLSGSERCLMTPRRTWCTIAKASAAWRALEQTVSGGEQIV